MNLQRIFGCGIDGQTFKTKYERLSEENKLRLERVARRVRLTLQLRYETAFYTSPLAGPYEQFILRSVELPSIEIYLLCTCLDTLAGEPQYLDFRDWLKTQPNVSGLGPEEEITRLYTQYKEEYGVGKNLRDLFRGLPQSVKDWLSNNVVIRPSDQPFAATGQDVNALVERLYMYFYDFRRNAFTHGSVSRHTLTAEDITAPKSDGWWVTPASLYLDKHNQQWSFSYRQGLDEATILRIIIHAVALQILDIEPTRELVLENISNYSRLNALYAFVSGVNRNSIAVKRWSKLDEWRRDDFSSFLIHVGIPPLDSKSSTVMVDRYLNNTLESGLRQMTTQYLKEINRINSAISDFNKSNPPSKDNRNLDERWRVIKTFLDELVKTPSCRAVLKWPSRVEMRNAIWWVIRDPCYTPSTIRT